MSTNVRIKSTVVLIDIGFMFLKELDYAAKVNQENLKHKDIHFFLIN
jgi:hypothetical protein